METRPRDGARTKAEIREEAAALFYKHGYESTSLRSVAAAVGIKVGSLYNHMGSKDELLLDIMLSVMETLIPMVESAADEAGEDPVDRLRAAVSAHIRFHAQHARETFIGNSEIRSLLPEQRQQVRKLREAYEQLLRTYIDEATKAAGVDPLDLRLQTYAVLALGMHTASWFRENSGVSLDQIVSVYSEIVVRQLGIEAAPRPDARAAKQTTTKATTTKAATTKAARTAKAKPRKTAGTGSKRPATGG